MLARCLVPNAYTVISLKTLRHFTNHISLQRQIANDNVKGSNTNNRQKKPSILGATEPPKIVHKKDTRTWLEKLKYSFSIESNVKTREYLVKEYQKSYWQDFNELRLQGEKLWEANEEVIKAEKALYLPNINARSLSKTNVDTMNLLRGNTTLLAVFFNRFGENQVKSFIEPFFAEFSNRPKIQLMQLNIETNILKSFILKLFIPSIRRATHQSLHKTYILLFRNDRSLREALNIHNAYRGYVFVVDADCKIRWFAHGYATSKEIETMSTIIKNLDKCKK